MLPLALLLSVSFGLVQHGAAVYEETGSFIVLYDPSCPAWQSAAPALAAASTLLKERGVRHEIVLRNLDSPVPELASLESALVARGTPMLAHIRLGFRPSHDEVQVFPGRLDSAAAIGDWVLAQHRALSERAASVDKAWLRDFLSEGLPTFQRGLQEAILRQEELSHELTIGRFSRECIRVEDILGRLHKRLDEENRLSQMAWAMQDSLMHARQDLYAAAVSRGSDHMEDREDALRAARLRLRVGRTLAAHVPVAEGRGARG